jgi:tetratricopeptide (TPR) repeat protein
MQRYLATHPQHAEAAGVLALLSLDNENVAEAKKWAEITLAADPDNLDGLLTDGALALATQDEEHAMATHQRAVARHPRSGRAWGGLGLTQMLALNLDAARRAVHAQPYRHLACTGLVPAHAQRCRGRRAQL